MTRKMTAAGTALCAILMVTVQINMSAQTKTPVKAPAKAAPAKTTPAKAAPAKAVPAKVAVAPVDPNSVTMIGCLESDGVNYRLSDVQGNLAPKGRSWKTGFVTKKTKNVDLVGASSTLNLKDNVGRKVSVIGVKEGETHLKARSVKQIGTCS
jgi:hypothetical protein